MYFLTAVISRDEAILKVEATGSCRDTLELWEGYGKSVENVFSFVVIFYSQEPHLQVSVTVKRN